LKYPQFDKTQYNCLKHPGEVGEFLASAIKLEDRLKELEDKRSKLQKAKDTCPAVQRQGLLDSILEMITPEGEEGPAPSIALASAQYRRSLDPHLAPHERQRMRLRACLALMQHYGEFNAEKFEADFAKQFPNQESLRDDYRTAHKAATRKRREVEDHWDNAPSLFHKVPKAFAEFRLTDKFDEALMAEVILRRFLRDWKKRAPLFAVPVTIYGTAIFSLPAGMRDEWLSAYSALGLDRIQKRPYYQALKDKTHATRTNAIESLLAGQEAEPEEVLIDG